MDAHFDLELECQEAWEEMREVGPGQRRCERCSETVVNLSRLSRKQALAVVESANPPCVSYLVRDQTPIFAREVARGGLLAAAASLLAACSAEEPSCELAPEPAAEVSLLDPSAPFGGPLPAEVGAPVPVGPATAAASQNRGTLDAARASDPNDVDGTSPGAPSIGPSRPTAPIHRRVGRIPIRRPSPPTASGGDRNDL